MYLNQLSGRRMNNPNNHPILPWIIDFQSENGGWRDLSRSKYRLTKGVYIVYIVLNKRG